jgi:hypothetical protein
VASGLMPEATAPGRSRGAPQADARREIILIAPVMIMTPVGCMVGPNYKPSFLRLPARWSGIEVALVQTKASHRASGAPVARPRWFLSYADRRAVSGSPC